MLSNILNLSLVALALPLYVLASVHNNPLLNRHHGGLAKRADAHVDLYNRAAGSRWSYYNVQTGNAGSCGRKHTNDQFTVAMNAGQMNSGLCFKTIRMTFNGKSTVATISDTCPGCPWNGLDLTEGLFAFFASHDAGIIYGDWEFTDAAPPPPPPKPKPTSRYQPPPRPTSIWTPPVVPTSRRTSTRRTSTTPTTTSTTPTPTSTQQSSTRASSSADSDPTSIDYSSGPASGLAIPTGTINTDPSTPQNLAEMYQAFVALGALAMVGANV